MPSGWGTYYIVFLSALLALAVPGVLSLISLIVSADKADKRVKLQEGRSVNRATDRTILGQRINGRFFLAANAALVLITFGLVLIPCSVTLTPGSSHASTLRSLVSIIVISGFAALGLLYSAKKGDLAWLRSYQRKNDE